MRLILDLNGEAIEQIVQTLADRLIERLTKQAESKQQESRNDLPELLSRKQAAKLLGISLPTLALWSSDTPDRNALIKAHRVNRTVRYRRDDIIDSLRVVKKFQRAK